MKKIILNLLAAHLHLWATTISISGPATCNQGTTCTYTASASGGSPTLPYVYSKVSGSVGSINPSTGVYTAPSTITAKNTIAGCMMLPNDHIHNTKVDALPVHTNSILWMSKIVANSNVGMGPVAFELNRTLSTAATTLFNFFYTTAGNGSLFHPPVDNLLRLENGLVGGLHFENISGTDHHYIGVNTDTCTVEELYQYYSPGYIVSCPTCRSQGGTDYSLNGYTFRPYGTDASGSQLLSLTVRPEEMQAHSIKHAMRLVLQGSSVNTTTNIWPAEGNNGSPNGCPAAPKTGTISDCLPYGARLRLKSTFTPTFDGNCSTGECQAQANAILTAFKTYGLEVNDLSGGGTQVTVMNGPVGPDTRQALVMISQISFLSLNNDFEVVDTSSLNTSQTHGIASPTWGGVKVDNSAGITPDDALTVKACDSAGSPVCGFLSVALIGVTIGVPHATEVLWATGTSYTKQLTATVHGASNTSVTWALGTSGGDHGSITSGGLYTMPSSVSARTETVATATSVADGTVTATVTLIAFPLADGTLRINSGDTADYTDGSSKLWHADFKSGTTPLWTSGTFSDAFGSPTWVGAAGTHPRVFDSNIKNVGDLVFDNITLEPNKSYLVKLLFGDNNVASGARILKLIAQDSVFVPSVDTFQGAQYTAFEESVTVSTGSTGELTFRVNGLGVPPTTVDTDGSVTMCCIGSFYSPPQFSFLAGFSVTLLSTPTITSSATRRGNVLRTGRALFSSVLSSVPSPPIPPVTPWKAGFWTFNNGQPLADMPWSKFTHVYLCCAASVGNVISQNWLEPANFPAVLSAAHAAHVNVILSVGGTPSDMISATDSGHIATYVSSIANYVNVNNFDGVDIDWEQSIVTAQYTDLLTRLRAALPTKLITMDTADFDNLIPVSVANYSRLDRLNVMCYDQANGAGISWHNDAVLRVSGGNPGGACNYRTGHLTAAGVPVGQLNIGIPAYGYSFTGTQTFNDAAGVFVSTQYRYSAIKANATWWNGGANHHYDSTHKADYLSVPSDGGVQKFITYNDTTSISDIVTWGTSIGVGGYFLAYVEQQYISSGSGDAKNPLATELFADAP